MPRKKQTRRHFDVKQKAEVYISPEALATAQREFEAGTGVCHECQGAGQQMISCSVIDGTTFGPCSRCKGVGKAPLKGKAE
jgi:excinuclease UvrABC ATPase subunit